MALIWLLALSLSLVVAQSSGQQDQKDWWKKIVFYQIYPRSFKDSNGDGIGDIKGIESKLDYLVNTGFGGVWLSPVYKSPMRDFGYDVQNYTEIDPSYGNMADFDKLLAAVKKRDLKLIMDFVPNHSSDQCEWFQKSIQREDPYTDYYMWVDGKKGPDGKMVPPNNWLGMFGGSAWEWNDQRQQFYYHQFVKEQPDFNVSNPKIREELGDVFRYWLGKGVAGFRIDAIKHMFEDPQLRDEPLTHDPAFKPDEYQSLEHIYTTSSPKVLEVLAEWRTLFDEFEKKDGFHRVMLVEINETIPNTVAYYGNETHPMADMPMNFEMFKISDTSTAEDVQKLVKDWLDGIPVSKWPNWIIGNHDQHRIANRTHPDLVDAANMINLLLKGTPISYYGEEIGMVDTEISWEDTRDPFGCWYGKDRYKKYSRDPERTPMQWDATKNAGFSTGDKPWLPVNPNYSFLNVAAETKSKRSHLKTYKRLVDLRQLPAGHDGATHFPVTTKTIFSFTRTLQDPKHVGLAVIVNFGSETETVDLQHPKENLPFRFPEKGVVVAISDMSSADGPQLNRQVRLNAVKLGAKQGIVIRFKPKWED